ncbi:internal scaffolding protein [Flyfo microvirus Tbat2_160]|nr:internal scaffolding protein [Flyfo microvirus Tbat2_160]
MNSATATNARKNFRTPYAPHKRFGMKGFGPSRTKQSFMDECDVNLIIKRHAETGVLPTFNNLEGHYGDFSNVDDYQSALNSVMHANAAFEALPSDVRNRFRNDPKNLLQFVLDEKNRDEAIALGLIEKPRTEDPMLSQQPSRAELNKQLTEDNLGPAPKRKSQSNASD